MSTGSVSCTRRSPVTGGGPAGDRGHRDLRRRRCPARGPGGPLVPSVAPVVPRHSRIGTASSPWPGAVSLRSSTAPPASQAVVAEGSASASPVLTTRRVRDGAVRFAAAAPGPGHGGDASDHQRRGLGSHPPGRGPTVPGIRGPGVCRPSRRLPLSRRLAGAGRVGRNRHLRGCWGRGRRGGYRRNRHHGRGRFGHRAGPHLGCGDLPPVAEREQRIILQPLDGGVAERPLADDRVGRVDPDVDRVDDEVARRLRARVVAQDHRVRAVRQVLGQVEGDAGALSPVRVGRPGHVLEHQVTHEDVAGVDGHVRVAGGRRLDRDGVDAEPRVERAALAHPGHAHAVADQGHGLPRLVTVAGRLDPISAAGTRGRSRRHTDRHRRGQGACDRAVPVRCMSHLRLPEVRRRSGPDGSRPSRGHAPRVSPRWSTWRGPRR